MIKQIAIILILTLLCEIPALAAPSPVILTDQVTVWTGEVELKNDVVVPAGSSLIISPGTRIKCVYNYENDQLEPREWQIIVKGELMANGVTFDCSPYGLSSLKIPVDQDIEQIRISAQRVDTRKIREEFSVFRLQYLALWTMLFAGVYIAIKTRNE
jgi:hypothetical protein